MVLSDGDDTSSLVAYDEVLDLAKRSETAIYAIGLKQNDGGGRDFKEAEFVLRQLSQETGGRAFYPGHVDRAAEDLRADRPGAGQPVRDRLHVEEPGAQRRLAPAVGASRRGRAWSAGPARAITRPEARR